MTRSEARAADTAAPPVPVGEGKTAARIGGDIVELVLLDQLWTELAQQNNPEDRERLGSIVEQMEALLNRLAGNAELILDRIRLLGEDELQAELSRAEAVKGDSKTVAVRSRARRDGGLLSMIETGLADVSGTFAHGASQIKADNERIKQGKAPAGDLDPMTHCGIGLIEMGLGLGYGGMGVGLLVDGAERVTHNCGG